MKKDISNNNAGDKNITRKQAIKKVGVTALTAASLMFLSTKKAAADSGYSPSGAPTNRGW
jgi:hypothetical protein